MVSSHSVTDPTLVYTAADSGALKIRRWRVRVLDGAEAGLNVMLERGSLLIGSARSNDLVLSDPCVSRAHLELRLLEKGIHIRDLGSSNGTFHKGTRIQESTVQGATVLKVGTTELALEPADKEVELDTHLERLGAMVGSCPEMRRLFGMVMQIAPTSVSVLIEAETGTGKELVANEIHNFSTRVDRPFVVVDCGALPSGLVESELFGHVRGAFTGAVANREGAFEYANGGTLFLDEIGELPTELQPKLLRALDQGQVKRVGDNTIRQVDVRVIAATSRELSDAVSRGTFRPDLFYRLAVVRLNVPPLRERLDDLPLLVEAIVSGIAGREIVVPEATLEKLRAQRWPGNVRELRNVISHALAIRPDATILELPATLGIEEESPRESVIAGEGFPQGGDYREAKRAAVDMFEVQYLKDLLARHKWNVSGAAREAGVDRNYLHRLMKRHRIKRPG